MKIWMGDLQPSFSSSSDVSTDDLKKKQAMIVFKTIDQSPNRRIKVKEKEIP